MNAEQPTVFFRIGERYPNLAGEYEVIGMDADWLTCRLDDGSEFRVTERNAMRALETATRSSAAVAEATHARIGHACEGRPCGPACVKLQGSGETGAGRTSDASLPSDENDSHEGGR